MVKVHGVAQRESKLFQDETKLSIDFSQVHFLTFSLEQQFYGRFMPRTKLPAYFVNLDNMSNLSNFYKSRRSMLKNIGWKDALLVNENVYLNFVKVFFFVSNMDFSQLIKIE